MILLCGVPSETPLAMVREQLDALHVPYVMLNQRCFSSAALDFEISRCSVTGQLWLAQRSYPLEEFCGVYTRLMDSRLLPELKDEQADSPKSRHCLALQDALTRWYEVSPARVVNRTAPMGSNFSKPYQAQLIRTQGFAVPETLITNDPDLVRAFYHQHKQVIYKSISGTRSVVQLLEEKDLQHLERILWCPTQFQAFVEGTNVRVHTVGTVVFATAIISDVIDYRYAYRHGGSEVGLFAVELSDALSERCLRLAQALELPFAGIDLKITPDKQVFCFEVNPSPAFSYYEMDTGQPISRAVARYLAGAE
jgi:glutathione synthase/RimK-type ligase-like ATP-grasp enzyme